MPLHKVGHLIKWATGSGKPGLRSVVVSGLGKSGVGKHVHVRTRISASLLPLPFAAATSRMGRAVLGGWASKVSGSSLRQHGHIGSCMHSHVHHT